MRGQLQPFRARTPTTSSTIAHRANAGVEAPEDVLGGTVVGTAALERVLAEHRDPHRPDEEEREDERRRRQAGDVPCLPVARRAVRRPAPEVHGAAEDPEILDPDQEPGDHRFDKGRARSRLDLVERPPAVRVERKMPMPARKTTAVSGSCLALRRFVGVVAHPGEDRRRLRSGRGRVAATSHARPAPAGSALRRSRLPG